MFSLSRAWGSARCESLRPSQAFSEHALHYGHIHGFLDSQEHEGAFQAFILQSISLPSLSSCLLFVPNCYPWTLVAPADVYERCPSGSCFSPWESSEFGKTKTKPFELRCLGSHHTGQNKQPQFIENKAHSSPSSTRNLYCKCGLLSSRPPPSWVQAMVQSKLKCHEVL